MKKRVITGICYVIVMAGLLVMKFLIPSFDGLKFGSLGIDVLFWLISIIGAYEFTRALGEHKENDEEGKNLLGGEHKENDKEVKNLLGGIAKPQRVVVLVTCAFIIPLFVIGKMVDTKVGNVMFPGETGLILILAWGSLGAMIAATLTVFDHDRCDLRSTAYAELCILYCGALACVGPNVNHLKSNSETAVLLLFILVPFVDAGAFFIGKLFGKLIPVKLAPKVSPNKTVVGAVGGVLGGIVAAVLTWVICEYTSVVPFDYAGPLPKVVLLILFSLPTSILAQMGDLFESALKRGCGIKDMGNLLPGHGGVLDRFDSMLFAAVSVVVCFMSIS